MAAEELSEKDVDAYSKQAFDALLDDVTAFLVSMDYNEAEIAHVIRLAATCFAGVTASDATDAAMKVQDARYGCTRRTLNCPRASSKRRTPVS